MSEFSFFSSFVKSRFQYLFGIEIVNFNKYELSLRAKRWTHQWQLIYVSVCFALSCLTTNIYSSGHPKALLCNHFVITFFTQFYESCVLFELTSLHLFALVVGQFNFDTGTVYVHNVGNNLLLCNGRRKYYKNFFRRPFECKPVFSLSLKMISWVTKTLFDFFGKKLLTVYVHSSSGIRRRNLL